jgi:hypothetical protein
MASREGKALNFQGFSGYYGYMSYHDGYGGFNYLSDLLFMNQSTWTDPNGVGYQNGWCDTGYQNEAAMSQAQSLGWIYLYGGMESANGHSFTLKSMNAASSFSDNAVWNVISYTERNGHLRIKAVDAITVSYTGEHVNFDTLGHRGDFRNIAAVAFQMVSYGNPGNTCTYGYAVFGLQLAIGGVRAKWSKTADLGNHGKLLTPWLLQHASQAVPIAGASGLHVHSDAGQPADLLRGQDHGHSLAAGHHAPLVEHFF